MSDPTLWLTIAASGALLGSTVTLIAVLAGGTRIAFLAAVIGMAVACFGNAIVAAQLAGDHDAVVRVFVGTWMSFAVPRSPAIVFGLETTFYKSLFVAVVGTILLFALWATTKRQSDSLEEDQILSISLLYAGATLFVFAPNLFQALVGWCLVSLLTGVLIRLARGRFLSNAVQTIPLGEKPASLVDRLIRTIARGAEFSERMVVDSIWKPLTCGLPNWVAEQVDHLQHETVSLQLIATAVGAFAVVLTWLI